MRGGVSDGVLIACNSKRSSPHAWGCFPPNKSLNLGLLVFPTCVGVFLKFKVFKFCYVSLPHMRGGVSPPATGKAGAFTSSPHAWGCFRYDTRIEKVNKVFPTCVGVFLRFKPNKMPIICLPHMRGGVSLNPVADPIRSESSPHAWGCFSE